MTTRGGGRYAPKAERVEQDRRDGAAQGAARGGRAVLGSLARGRRGLREQRPGQAGRRERRNRRSRSRCRVSVRRPRRPRPRWPRSTRRTRTSRSSRSILSPTANTAYQQLTTRFVAGSGTPDVIISDVVWPATFAKAGWIAPLDKYSPNLSQFFPAQASTVTVQRPRLRDSLVHQRRRPVLPDRPGENAARPHLRNWWRTHRPR